MKKLTIQLLYLLMLSFVFQSCSQNSKTYAEMLADETSAIKSYIKKNNIKVITSEEFLKDTTTAENEYAYFSDSKIYIHIDKKGDGTFKSNEVILSRFLEVDIASGDTTLTNYYDNTSVDQFRYTKTTSATYGQFFLEQSQKAYMLSAYGSAVPSGWLMPLQYVGDGAKVKIIVPSDQGHSTAQQYVTPYFYEIEYIKY